jgi:hypothetical protein
LLSICEEKTEHILKVWDPFEVTADSILTEELQAINNFSIITLQGKEALM